MSAVFIGSGKMGSHGIQTRPILIFDEKLYQLFPRLGTVFHARGRANLVVTHKSAYLLETVP